MNTSALISLFANNLTLTNVFQAIASARSIAVRDLKEKENADFKDSLDRLKQAKLIKEESSPISDFNVLYVTSEGLSAEKELSRSGLLDVSSVR